MKKKSKDINQSIQNIQYSNIIIQSDTTKPEKKDIVAN